MKHEHNLHHLFPPGRYYPSKAWFYPTIDGALRVPGNDRVQSWQPCFSAEGLVEEAVANICAWFEANPYESFYSLAINDSYYFCECSKCLPRYQGETFLGAPNASDLYYHWANAVAEGVLARFPDKWFGTLAYNNLIEPPSFSIHPRIVPFMTFDRLKWVDGDVKEHGLELTRLFEEKTGVLAWYDYLYGTPYCIPRIYFHQMAANYAHAARLGVKAHVAEAYPNWGEGPKLWLALKLQWNPLADVDALLKTWYEAAVGKEAAADLAAFYQFWETYWTERIVDSDWFKAPGQFMWFGEPYYLNGLTHEDLTRSRALLDAVLQKCGSRAQKKRARLIAKAFDYYQASGHSYLGLVNHDLQPGKDRDHYIKLNRKRKKFLKKYQDHPFLLHRFRMDTRASLNLLDWENTDALKAHLLHLADLRKKGQNQGGRK